MDLVQAGWCRLWGIYSDSVIRKKLQYVCFCVSHGFFTDHLLHILPSARDPATSIPRLTLLVRNKYTATTKQKVSQNWNAITFFAFLSYFTWNIVLTSFELVEVKIKPLWLVVRIILVLQSYKHVHWHVKVSSVLEIQANTGREPVVGLLNISM